MVNTLFQKREEHGVTCKSGGSSKQVDYIFGRHSKVKDINCKVVAGWSVERKTAYGGVQNDSGSEEDEKDKGKLEKQMVRVDKRRMLCAFQGYLEVFQDQLT